MINSIDIRNLILFAAVFFSIGLGLGIFIGWEPDGKVLSKWYELSLKDQDYCVKTYTGKYKLKYGVIECFTVIGKIKLDKDRRI